MMVIEDVENLPSSNKFGPGGPWVKVLPMTAPLSWRLRDAWEVLRGRAEAVRESTIDDVGRWPVRDQEPTP
jgi:hypothetical protein